MKRDLEEIIQRAKILAAAERRGDNFGPFPAHEALDLAWAIDKIKRSEYVPQPKWVEVEGYEGVLQHCGSRDAVKLEKDHGVWSGVFAYQGGKFYALKLPYIPQP